MDHSYSGVIGFIISNQLIQQKIELINWQAYADLCVGLWSERKSNANEYGDRQVILGGLMVFGQICKTTTIKIIVQSYSETTLILCLNQILCKKNIYKN